MINNGVEKFYKARVAKLKDVESDGKVLTQARDPPGQRSSYILPGNPVRETYRLITFQKFPNNVPVHPCSLASSGFFYTGYKDRVKCFSCGFCVENWQLNDDPTDSRWHRDECQFVNGNDLRNVPLGSPIRISSSVMNIKSAIADSSRPSRSPSTSRCNPASSAPALPSCSTPTQRPQFNSVPARNEVSAIRVATFPCLHPINPHMRARESRLQTFLDHMSSWPAHRISATPQEIAEAGMYFLGERDRVKCWYCNGGLQNWEREDSPWEEHAKWFPQCEFLLQQKGPEFVDSIVARFPDIRRPVLHNPASYSTRNGSRPSTSSTSSPQIVDPRKELNEIKSRIDQELNNSEVVAQARMMGFHQKLLRKTLKREFLKNKQFFSTCASFVDALLKEEKEMENEDDSMDVDPFNLSSNNIASSSVKRSQHPQEDGGCRVCPQEEACVVLIPCGHLACCLKCSDKTKKCPVCREIIREKIHSYLS